MRCIYIYQNKINLKVYIGQTNNFSARKSQHKRSAFITLKTYPIYNAIRKYGLDNFNIYKLEYVSEDEVDEAERDWIKCFKSNDKNYGYNLESGGHLNKNISQETKQKLSLIRKKYHETHDNAFLGKSHTKESKQKMSLANMGKCYNSPEHMERITKIAAEKHKGVSLSAEVKEKISKSRKGKRPSKEIREKMSKIKSELGLIVGEKNPCFGKKAELSFNSKFTWDIIDSIRLDYNNKIKRIVIMRKYNISGTHFYRIVKNEIWKEDDRTNE